MPHSQCCPRCHTQACGLQSLHPLTDHSWFLSKFKLITPRHPVGKPWFRLGITWQLTDSQVKVIEGVFVDILKTCLHSKGKVHQSTHMFILILFHLKRKNFWVTWPGLDTSSSAAHRSVLTFMHNCRQNTQTLRWYFLRHLWIFHGQCPPNDGWNMDDDKEGTMEGKDDNEEISKERGREICHETGRNGERKTLWKQTNYSFRNEKQ